MNRIIRVLVAVVLVCVLLASWSPIRVQALVLESAAVTVAVDALIVVGAALIGLGVLPNMVSPDSFNAVVDSGVAALTSAGYVAAGLVPVYQFATGSFSYGLKTDVVQFLQDWLWTSETVKTSWNPTLIDSECLSWAAALSYAQGCKSAYWVGQDDTLKIIICPNSKYVTYSAEESILKINRTYISFSFYDGGNKWIKVDGGTGMLTYTNAVPIVTTQGIVANSMIDLGVVAPAGTQIETELGDYIVIYNPTGVPDTGGSSGDDDTPKEIPIIPIPILPTYEQTIQLPQEGIWEGNKVEIETPDPGTGNDPGTDSGTGEGGSVAETPWENFKKWISEGWKSIIQAIPTPNSIAEAVGNVIKSIFVPDADFISEKWNAIRSRFDFADSVSSSGELILDVLNGIDPEPPVIYVDLGDAEGSYYLGGQVAFLDLRWYERYKPTGDAIISAFLWLVFVWRMFMKLPGIIGGLPGDFVMQGVTDLGLADRLPARKKEYENQRQENRRFFKK